MSKKVTVEVDNNVYEPFLEVKPDNGANLLSGIYVDKKVIRYVMNGLVFTFHFNENEFNRLYFHTKYNTTLGAFANYLKLHTSEYDVFRPDGTLNASKLISNNKKYKRDVNSIQYWLGFVDGSTTSMKSEKNLKEEPPILDKTERRYLKNVIHPYKDRIKSITKKKCRCADKYFICITFYVNEKHIEDEYTNDEYVDNIILPEFNASNLMYVGMKVNKEYTLEELKLK